MDDIRILVLKALKTIDDTIIENSVQIKYYQSFKDRIDAFGEYQNELGIFEFAISFDKKGKLKRSHVNMISPKRIRSELEDKIHKK
ncbi:MAG: hypothetical protein QXW51_05835 [Sulfolobaceae archaeon]